ncbi:MAG: hypothetical protein ACOYMS_00375 [Terrimicrobiaceae bacterium]
MNIRFLPLPASFLYLVTALVFLVPQIRADTPMEKSWERLEKAFHKLRDRLKDPKDSNKETYVKLGAIIKEETLICMELDPKMLKNVPPAEQETFLQNYRRDMAAFDADVDKLNAALQAGQLVEAQNVITLLGKAKKEGHKAYREKDTK